MLRRLVLSGGSGLVISSEARGAWRDLESRVRPYVARRVASPADVDDVVQDVFIRIHRGLGGLCDDDSFGGWVYRIAERAVIDHRRARARHPLVPSPSEHEPPETRDEDGGDTDDGLQSELAECVALFVASLPSPYREAITLTELQGLTQQEAADLVGISLSGMKSRVQRGRAQIRKMFHDVCEISLDARGRVIECTPRGCATRQSA